MPITSGCDLLLAIETLQSDTGYRKGEKPVSSTDLDIPDIGDPTLEAEVVRDIILLKYVVGLGLTLFAAWIITMLLLP